MVHVPEPELNVMMQSSPDAIADAVTPVTVAAQFASVSAAEARGDVEMALRSEMATRNDVNEARFLRIKRALNSLTTTNSPVFSARKPSLDGRA